MRPQDSIVHLLATAGGSGLIGYGLKLLLERQRQEHQRKLEAQRQEHQRKLEAQRQEHQRKLEAQRYQTAKGLLGTMAPQNLRIDGYFAAEANGRSEASLIEPEPSAEVIAFPAPRSEDDDP